MNVVIPKNFQEAQQFLQHLKSLDAEQLVSLTQLYKNKGYVFDLRPNGEGLSHKVPTFFIKKNEETILYEETLLAQLVFKLGKKLHRLNGPAIERADGTKEWYQNGVLHREDGPAVENLYGKRWYKNGKLHRENGPAIESDRIKKWYYKDEELDLLIRDFVQFVNTYIKNEKNEIKKRLNRFDVNIENEDDIKSFIEFLWENGYQFDEYLNDYEIEEFRRDSHELDMLKIKSKNEENIMKLFRRFYFADKSENIIKGLIDESYESYMEALKNINLLKRHPWPEEIFKNWQTYDELQESFYLKCWNLIND